LFTAHELNPVAQVAQANVPIPEGLDLDVWIVPSQQDRIMEEEADNTVRKVKRSKKGKGKEINGTRTKSGKQKQKEDDSRDTHTVPELETETAEERAERETVLFLSFVWLSFIFR
jgi:AP-3 complex subunit delta